MKNNKFLKLVLFGSILTSFLFVLFFAIANNVYAEEIPNNEDTATTETTDTELPVGGLSEFQTYEEEPIIVDEGVNGEQPQNEEEEVNGLISFFKDWTYDDVRGVFIAFWSLVGTDGILLVTLVIALLRARLKKIREDVIQSELKNKLTVEHQKKLEDIANEYDKKLEELQNQIKDFIKSKDEKQKAQLQDNIKTLKTQLDNIKIDVE